MQTFSTKRNGTTAVMSRRNRIAARIASMLTGVIISGALWCFGSGAWADIFDYQHDQLFTKTAISSNDDVVNYNGDATVKIAVDNRLAFNTYSNGANLGLFTGPVSDSSLGTLVTRSNLRWFTFTGKTPEDAAEAYTSQLQFGGNGVESTAGTGVEAFNGGADTWLLDVTYYRTTVDIAQFDTVQFGGDGGYVITTTPDVVTDTGTLPGSKILNLGTPGNSDITVLAGHMDVDCNSVQFGGNVYGGSESGGSESGGSNEAGGLSAIGSSLFDYTTVADGGSSTIKLDGIDGGQLTITGQTAVFGGNAGESMAAGTMGSTPDSANIGFGGDATINVAGGELVMNVDNITLGGNAGFQIYQTKQTDQTEQTDQMGETDQTGQTDQTNPVYYYGLAGSGSVTVTGGLVKFVGQTLNIATGEGEKTVSWTNEQGETLVWNTTAEMTLNNGNLTLLVDRINFGSSEIRETPVDRQGRYVQTGGSLALGARTVFTGGTDSSFIANGGNIFFTVGPQGDSAGDFEAVNGTVDFNQINIGPQTYIGLDTRSLELGKWTTETPIFSAATATSSATSQVPVSNAAELPDLDSVPLMDSVSGLDSVSLLGDDATEADTLVFNPRQRSIDTLFYSVDLVESEGDATGTGQSVNLANLTVKRQLITRAEVDAAESGHGNRDHSGSDNSGSDNTNMDLGSAGRSFTALERLEAFVSQNDEAARQVIQSTTEGDLRDSLNVFSGIGLTGISHMEMQRFDMINQTIIGQRLMDLQYGSMNEFACCQNCDTGEIPGCVVTWGSAYGGRGTSDTNGFQSENHFDTWGGIIGVEQMLRCSIKIGAYYAFGSSDYEMSSSETSLGADSFDHTFGLYGRFNDRLFGGYGVFNANFTLNSFESDRIIMSENYAGSFDANGGGVYYEKGWDYTGKHARLNPYLALQYQTMQFEQLNERSTGSLRLKTDDWSVDSFRSHLGARLNIQVFEDVRFYASAAWTHEFDGDCPLVNVMFASTPDTRMALRGNDLGEDWLSLGLGLRFDLNQTFVFHANYNLQVGDSTFNTGLGTIEVKF